MFTHSLCLYVLSVAIEVSNANENTLHWLLAHPLVLAIGSIGAGTVAAQWLTHCYWRKQDSLKRRRDSIEAKIKAQEETLNDVTKSLYGLSCAEIVAINEGREIYRIPPYIDAQGDALRCTQRPEKLSLGVTPHTCPLALITPLQYKAIRRENAGVRPLDSMHT